MLSSVTRGVAARRSLTVAIESLEFRRLLSGANEFEPEGPASDVNDQISEATPLGAVGTEGVSTSGPFGISPGADDVDMFSFDVVAGQTVGFDVDREGGSTLDAFMRLFDVNGNELAIADDGTAPDEAVSSDQGLSGYFEFTFATAGTFFVGVSSFGNNNYDPVTGTGDSIGDTTGDFQIFLTNRFAALDIADGFYPDRLTATGTDGVDDLFFDVDPATGDSLVTLNGQTLRFLAGFLEGEQVLDGGDGDDTVSILRVGTAANPDAYSVTARGGLGVDTMFVGQNGELDTSIFGTATLDPEPASSTAFGGFVNLSNTSDLGGTFVSNEVDGDFQTFDKLNSDLGLIRVDVDDNVLVSFLGGGGGNIYDIQTLGENLQTSSGNNFELNLFGNGGDDTFQLGEVVGDFDDNFTGSLRIFPGDNFSSLRLVDFVEQDAGETYDFTGVFGQSGFSLQKPGTDFGGLEVARSLTDLTLLTNDLDSTINLGNDLDEIAADIFIDAGDGNNTLNVIDDNDLFDDTYLLDGNLLTKPGNDETFEQLLFLGITGGLSLTGNFDESTYNVAATSVETSITGGPFSDIFSVGSSAQNLDFIAPSIDIDGGGGEFDALFINDQQGEFPDEYVLTGTIFDRPGVGGSGTVTFDDIDSLTVNGNDEANGIFVRSVADDVEVTVNAGGGDDTFFVGNNDLDANILGTLILDGQGGTDDLVVQDLSDDAGADVYNFEDGVIDKRVGAFDQPVVEFSFNGVESTTVSGSPINSVYLVTSIDNPLTINAGDGGSVTRLSFFDSDLDDVAAPVVVNGGPGLDFVLADDRLDSGGDDYVVTGTDGGVLTKPANPEAFSGLTMNAVDGFTLGTGVGEETIFVEDGTNVQIQAGGGDDTIIIDGNDPATPVVVRGEGGADAVILNGFGVTPASARFIESEVLRELTLETGTSLTVDAGGDKIIDLVQPNLAIADNAVSSLLDLNDNALIVRNAADNLFFRDQLVRGFNGGGWDGIEGITSSVARDSALADGFAYSTAGQLGITQVFGEPVTAIDSVVVYGLLSDANLDGTINLADFGRLRAGFGTGSFWTDGDFNYDGSVNLADFGILRSNFGQTLASPISLFDEE
ncbi:MAG: pre-peptidase C-terminal domain-containing protein [Planctomycetota bacterium]